MELIQVDQVRERVSLGLLPREVHRIIEEYVVDNFTDLLLLSTLSKYWCNYVNNSYLWFNCGLKISRNSSARNSCASPDYSTELSQINVPLYSREKYFERCNELKIIRPIEDIKDIKRSDWKQMVQSQRAYLVHMNNTFHHYWLFYKCSNRMIDDIILELQKIGNLFTSSCIILPIIFAIFMWPSLLQISLTISVIICGFNMLIDAGVNALILSKDCFWHGNHPRTHCRNALKGFLLALITLYLACQPLIKLAMDSSSFSMNDIRFPCVYYLYAVGLFVLFIFGVQYQDEVLWLLVPILFIACQTIYSFLRNWVVATFSFPLIIYFSFYLPCIVFNRFMSICIIIYYQDKKKIDHNAANMRQGGTKQKRRNLVTQNNLMIFPFYASDYITFNHILWVVFMVIVFLFCLYQREGGYCIIVTGLLIELTFQFCIDAIKARLVEKITNRMS